MIIETAIATGGLAFILSIALMNGVEKAALIEEAGRIDERTGLRKV